jgi:AbrB family transcriptional regulator (stage V sporulation protein T)|nr:MAG TPA_asm: stage V sporulation protein T [Caudoviricetes sp.]
MKATGIIRRIDDLGRVVIPRDIRRSLKIHEGDPLEIFIENNGVCFQKCSTLGSLAEESLRIAIKMASNSGLRPIAIYDADTKLRGMENFPSYVSKTWEDEDKPFEYNATYGVYPIDADGDRVGYVVCDSQDMGCEVMMIARYLSTVVED